jgi:hypothetical protein
MKMLLMGLLLAPLLLGAQVPLATRKLLLFAYYDGTQELEAYIAERGPQGLNPLLSEADVAGLRRQEFTLDSEQLLLDDGVVLFPYSVSYNMLSDFISKDYVGLV